MAASEKEAKGMHKVAFCDGCFNEIRAEDIFVCSSCQEGQYRSETCQENDWNFHKRFCKILGATVAFFVHLSNHASSLSKKQSKFVFALFLGRGLSSLEWNRCNCGDHTVLCAGTDAAMVVADYFRFPKSNDSL
jgi:hypothetical protein